jgi:hypothetical protein
MTTELTGDELDRALATALGLKHRVSGSPPDVVSAIHAESGFWVDPATTVVEAFRLAMWLVDNRDWSIRIHLGIGKVTTVDCYTLEGGEGAVVSANPAEAICRSILAAV